MADIERIIRHSAGPRFERVDGEVMFSFIIDPSNMIGPRPAKRIDQEQYAGEWEAFCLADGVSALDRDADGEPGGSLPGSDDPEPVQDHASEAEKNVERDQLRSFLDALGKEWHPKHSVKTLRKMVDDATSPET